MIKRTLGGVILAKLGNCTTIRLETGSKKKVTIPCVSRIGDRVHVYIDRSLNEVIRIVTANCPDHWDGDIEPEPIDMPGETEDIPHLEFLEDQEVLGKQKNEGKEAWDLECCAYLCYENESVLDDVFAEDIYTQAGDPSHKIKENYNE